MFAIRLRFVLAAFSFFSLLNNTNAQTSWVNPFGGTWSTFPNPYNWLTPPGTLPGIPGTPGLPTGSGTVSLSFNALNIAFAYSSTFTSASSYTLNSLSFTAGASNSGTTIITGTGTLLFSGTTPQIVTSGNTNVIMTNNFAVAAGGSLLLNSTGTGLLSF